MGDQTESMQVVQAGEVMRSSFGGHELARSGETAATAMAERSKALVQAKFIMALQRPRDLDDVRVKLMKECKRPGFAATARYAKPIGGNKRAEGFSIRFMEAVARCMGNLDIQVTPVNETDRVRIMEIAIIDLETNNSESVTVVMEKTVERRALKDGEVPISQRLNSNGEVTYLVAATEDQLLAKQNAAISKAKRNAIQHMIAGDILDDCKAQLVATIRSEDKRDPAAARKALADGFAAMGVSPSALKAYLGHDLETCAPAEIESLRELYQAIRDGETTWREASATDDAEKPRKSTLSEKIAAKANKADAHPANGVPVQAAAHMEAPLPPVPAPAPVVVEPQHDAATGEVQEPEQEPVTVSQIALSEQMVNECKAGFPGEAARGKWKKDRKAMLDLLPAALKAEVRAAVKAAIVGEATPASDDAAISGALMARITAAKNLRPDIEAIHADIELAGDRIAPDSRKYLNAQCVARTAEIIAAITTNA